MFKISWRARYSGEILAVEGRHQDIRSIIALLSQDKQDFAVFGPPSDRTKEPSRFLTQREFYGEFTITNPHWKQYTEL